MAYDKTGKVGQSSFMSSAEWKLASIMASTSTPRGTVKEYVSQLPTSSPETPISEWY